MRRAVAGFLLQLALGAGEGILFLRVIPDQTGGKLEAILAERHPVLLDQQDMSRIECQDHCRADVAGAPGVFPASPPLGDHETAGPFEHFGSIGVGGKRAFGHAAA